MQIYTKKLENRRQMTLISSFGLLDPKRVKEQFLSISNGIEKMQIHILIYYTGGIHRPSIVKPFYSSQQWKGSEEDTFDCYHE